MNATDEDERRYFFQCAREQVSPYLQRLRSFTNRTEVFPSVTSVPLPGHTPGHSGYLIDSGGDSLLIWGDLIHVPELQIERPEVTMSFDIDPMLAEKTRRDVFADVAHSKRLVAGMHIDFPGFGYVIQQGEKFPSCRSPFQSKSYKPISKEG